MAGRSGMTDRERAALRARVAQAQQAAMIRVGRETQGRGGKGVTVITGLPLGPVALEALAKELKARCGAGGKARPDGVIEIQGEHRDLLIAELTKRGYSAKRAGG
jgi:translation initiation factor 1